MIANPRISAVVGLLLTIAFSQCHSRASDATIDWHYVGDGRPVTAFTLTPPNPSTVSLITFIAPIDGSNYLNGVCASVKFGVPIIAVNATNRTIDVTFSGHLSACPNIVLPVSGLEGHAGPLTAGTWSINVGQGFPPTVYFFSVELVPPSLSVQAGVASSLELSWPVSADTYALEATDNLVSSNWQAVTNSPTVSSNRYTLQISGNSGSRFFRLHRL